jgi:uncharacterized protein YdaU (DUF1376 family)
MSKMPWVRFFPSDWLGGTRGMSAVETGIYITLIATMYERGEPIVEDHSRLARLCGASNSAFKKALETLLDEGKIIRTPSGLWNDRVEKEQVYLSEKSEVGSRAANARWNKNGNENNDRDHADALPTQSPGNANQKPDTRESSSLRSEDNAGASAKRKTPPDVDAFKSQISTVLDADRVDAICTVRRKKGAVFSEHAGKLLVAALMACPDAAAAADEMVLRNWTGVKPEWLAGRSANAQAPPQRGSGNAMVDRLDQLMAGMERGNDGRTVEASDEHRDDVRPAPALLGFAPSGRIIEGR